MCAVAKNSWDTATRFRPSPATRRTLRCWQRAARDKTVRLWDLRAPAAANVIHTPGSNINLAYSPDGRYLTAGDKSETVVLVDAQQGSLVRTIKDGATDREEVRTSTADADQ